MAYSLTQIFHRIRQTGKLYALLVLQLCIAFVLLTIAINGAVSLQKEYDTLAAKADKSHIRVDILDTARRDGTFDAALFSTFETAPDCPMGLLTKVMLGATWDGMPENMVMLCVPEPYYRNLFAEPGEADTIYCTRTVYEALMDGKLTIFGGETPLTFTDGVCMLADRTYTLCILTDIDENVAISQEGQWTYTQTENDIPIDKILFFPMEAGVGFQDSTFVSYQVYCYPQTDDQYARAYDLLWKNLQNIPVSIYDPAAFLMQWCQDIADTTRILTAAALFLLTVTLLTTVGSTWILLYKRKKDYAIQSVLGCTTGRLYAELFWELFIVCTVGIGVGCLLSIPILPFWESLLLRIPVSFTIEAAATALGADLGIAASVTVLSLYGTGKIDAATTLRGE